VAKRLVVAGPAGEEERAARNGFWTRSTERLRWTPKVKVHRSSKLSVGALEDEARPASGRKAEAEAAAQLPLEGRAGADHLV